MNILQFLTKHFHKKPVSTEEQARTSQNRTGKKSTEELQKFKEWSDQNTKQMIQNLNYWSTHQYELEKSEQNIKEQNSDI